MSVDDLKYLKDEGRWGVILVRDRYLLDSRLRAFLGQCIIFRAEYLWSSKAVQYDILHPDLPAVEKHIATGISRYRVYETADGKIRFDKRPDGHDPLPEGVTEFTC